MKKKTMALLMALTFTLASGISACAKPDPAPPDEPVPSGTADPSQTPPAETGTPPAETNGGTESPASTDDPGDVTGDEDATLTVVIEGESETIPGIRHNSWLGYAMTYDPELFTFNQVDETADSYMAEPEEGRPNVYLSVSVIEDLSFEETVEGMRLQKGIEDEGRTASIGAHSYAATQLSYAAGTGSSDEVVEYFITEQNGTVFVIALGCFVEGEEGFGARLNAMLDTMTF